MGIYEKGEKIKSIEEYSTYPFSHLYAHGKLIGKSITDNWQYRILKNGIENGWLCKAKLTEGYKRYHVEIHISNIQDSLGLADYFSSSIYECVAASEKEAEHKTLLAKIKYDNPISSDVNGEYLFSDGSGMIKLKVKEIKE